ncbi:protein of unknown function [Clostridium beijerinckii]|nr:protein of unknown function [Clostridium beijerinckii]
MLRGVRAFCIVIFNEENYMFGCCRLMIQASDFIKYLSILIIKILK